MYLTAMVICTNVMIVVDMIWLYWLRFCSNEF